MDIGTILILGALGWIIGRGALVPDRHEKRLMETIKTQQATILALNEALSKIIDANRQIKQRLEETQDALEAEDK